MDSEMAASRRMKVVAGHFAPSADGPCPPSHTAAAACLLPMNCSSCSSSVLNPAVPPRRCDNRMHFARQSSSSQSFFMRQQAPPPPQQEKKPFRCPASSGSGNGFSSSPLFSRPKNTADRNFCRQAAAAPSSRSFVHSSRMYELPDYSRPDSSSPVPSLLPEFAKPSIAGKAPGGCRSTGEKQLPANNGARCSSRSNEIGWSPRMDVRETAGCFLVTVEIPGGDIHDMRVEVDDHNLNITGKKCLPAAAMALPTTANGPCSSAAYHRREILQGPFQVMWQLPSCTNKDSVSAEFVNGLLHVTVPKL